jgi:hypothetical protein
LGGPRLLFHSFHTSDAVTNASHLVVVLPQAVLSNKLASIKEVVFGKINVKKNTFDITHNIG